jgi:hypothetical protein
MPEVGILANISNFVGHSTGRVAMASRADPVQLGLIGSLARRGGNVTGLTNFAEELAPKQLDFDAGPLAVPIAHCCANQCHHLHVPQKHETQNAAGRASLVLVPFEYRVPDDLERAFVALPKPKRRRCWSHLTQRLQPTARARWHGSHQPVSTRDRFQRGGQSCLK